MRIQQLSQLSFMALAILASAIPLNANAEDAKYNPPTRGFFIEHGLVAGSGNASVELHSGSSEIENGGGVRLGLPKAELILNSGLNAYDENEALLKYALTDIHLDDSSSHPIAWTLVAGVSHIDYENEQGNTVIDQTNIKVGAAFTVDADAATFTFGPRLVYADGDAKDDEFLELDLGAYVGIIDTEAGLFSAGIETLITTADDEDNTIALGVRWAYNERLTVDLVPLVMEDDELFGLPGLVRVNASF